MQSTDTNGTGPSADVLARIQKLLKLAAAGSGATEAEAAAALNAAQRLLTRYNLDQAALEADGKVVAEPVNHIDIEVTNEDWRVALWRAAGAANFCKVIRVTNPGKSFHMTWVPCTIHIVGKATNRVAVIEMVNWLLAQIEGVPTGRVNKYGGPVMTGGLYYGSFKDKPAHVELKDWRYGFFNGISARLCERLSEMTNAQAIDLPGSMALMCTSTLAVNNYANATWHLTATRAQGTRTDGGATALGYAAGNRVTIAKNSLGGGMPRLAGGRG